MIIYIDTREQRYWHIAKFFLSQNIKFERKKLDYGDYSFKENNISYEKRIVIERKNSIEEFASCIYGEKRRRIKERMIQAQIDKAIFILLIENCTIDKIKNWEYGGMDRNGIQYGKIHPNCILGALSSWPKKHDIYISMKNKNISANYIYSVFKRYSQKYNYVI